MIERRHPRRFQFRRHTAEGAHRIHFQRLRVDTGEHGKASLIRLLVLMGIVLFLVRWLAR